MLVLKDFPMVADNLIVLPYMHIHTRARARAIPRCSKAQPDGTDEIRNKFLGTHGHAVQK